jgi:hypothetical protein
MQVEEKCRNHHCHATAQATSDEKDASDLITSNRKGDELTFATKMVNDFELSAAAVIRLSKLSFCATMKNNIVCIYCLFSRQQRGGGSRGLIGEGPYRRAAKQLSKEPSCLYIHG